MISPNSVNPPRPYLQNSPQAATQNVGHAHQSVLNHSSPAFPESANTRPYINTREGGDSALALLIAKAMREGASDSGYPENIENIPKDSTFGEWWSHLHDALKSPKFVAWAKSKGIDLSKPIEISPKWDTLSFTAGGKTQIFMERDQGVSWPDIAGPIMDAAKVLSPEGRPLCIESADRTSAPYDAVAHFHDELDNRRSIAAIEARAEKLEQDKAFAPIAPNDPYRPASARSEEALKEQKAKLADTTEKHTLAFKLLYILVGHRELPADLKYRTTLERHDRNYVLPGDVQRRLKGAVLNSLSTTQISVQPGSSYATAQHLKAGETVSLHKYLADQGVDRPESLDELKNHVRALITPALSQPANGDLGGAMSWPIPLAGQAPSSLRSVLADNSLGLTDRQQYSSESGVLGYLTANQAVNRAHLNDPRKVIETLLGSPKAQQLGLALQNHFKDLPTPSSINDWTLAALNGTLDLESPASTPRTHVAGFDLMHSRYWGQHPSEVTNALAQHLVSQKRASPEMGLVAAHLLLSHKAPQFLVKDIPEKLSYGSHSWVTFSTAVARIEARQPGATSTMSFADIMARADVGPIDATDREVEYAAQNNALKSWGVANGIIPSNPQDVYTDAQMVTVRKAFNDQLKELSAASVAQATPMPVRKEMALEELKRIYGDKIPFKKKCISSFPEQREYPGPYSVLDLYVQGNINNPPGFDWSSSSSTVDIRTIQGQANRLKDINASFKAALPKYFTDIENSVGTHVKHLISIQPLEVRKDVEFGKLTLMHEYTIGYEWVSVPGRAFQAPTRHRVEKDPVRKNKNQLVKIEREGEVRTYEIDIRSGEIKRYTGNDKPGRYPAGATHPHTSLVEATPKGEYAPGWADEKTETKGLMPTSFSSLRTRNLAKTFVEDMNIKQFEAEAKGLTTFESEVPSYKKGREFMLNLIPLRSAIKNFQAGNIGEGIADLAFDIFGFAVGVGAAAKGAKALQAGASVLSKAAHVGKIVGRGAIGALNPLDGVFDIARSVYRVGKAGVQSAGRAVGKLAHPADAAGWFTAGKRLDVPSFGTFKLNNEWLEGPAVLKGGQWHSYNTVTGKAYGPALGDFTPVFKTPQLSGVDGAEKFIDDLLKARLATPGAMASVRTLEQLKQFDFAVPSQIFRGHTATGDTIATGLRRAAGTNTSGDDYLASIIKHTARTSGSGGEVMSFSASKAKANSFATQYSTPTKKVPVFTVDTTQDPKAFRTVVDIILKDGERLVAQKKITKATLLQATDKLSGQELEVFYVKGDIPAAFMLS